MPKYRNVSDVTCKPRKGWYFTSHVHFTCIYSAIRVVFISVNQALGHRPQASCLFTPLLEQAKIICFSSFQYNYFIPLLGNLYLPSRDIRKSYISLLATKQVIIVMAPRAQGRSTRWSAVPFIDQAMLEVLSLTDVCFLCIQHGLPRSWVLKTLASRAKHQPQWTSTIIHPTHQQRHSGSAWRFQRGSDDNYTTADPGHSATITREKCPRLPWTLFKPKLHQTINGHLPDRAWHRERHAYHVSQLHLAFPGHPARYINEIQSVSSLI